MQSLWMELSDAINPSGEFGYTFTFGPDAAVYHRCLVCNAKFPQTDDGWKALKQHGFDEHEDLMHFDWRELHGKQVTIGVVERPCNGQRYGNELPAMQVDLIARTEDGTVYFLPEGDTEFTSDYMRGGYKCKPKSRASSLLGITSPAPASPSSG